MGIEKAANEGPERRNKNGDMQMGMLHKHVQSDSRDFVKRTDNVEHCLSCEMVPSLIARQIIIHVPSFLNSPGSRHKSMWKNVSSLDCKAQPQTYLARLKRQPSNFVGCGQSAVPAFQPIEALR
ncbi:hypothetical protein C8J57DRAFT_1250627 [Mycena rebaudengoi]|nr:hypothetical protein C8J57DRAFT_1250627 [Mycena rebaudengoi]